LKTHAPQPPEEILEVTFADAVAEKSAVTWNQLCCVLIETSNAVSTLGTMWCLGGSHDKTCWTVSLSEKSLRVGLGISIHLHCTSSELLRFFCLFEIDDHIPFLWNGMRVAWDHSWLRCEPTNECVVMQQHADYICKRKEIIL
jgi:hypothetical protein